MLKCGLLGKTLGHSRSPEIHRYLGDYEYLLYEKREDELESFLREGDWTGMNVTIPYKKAVLPFLDALSPQVRDGLGDGAREAVRRPADRQREHDPAPA